MSLPPSNEQLMMRGGRRAQSGDDLPQEEGSRVVSLVGEMPTVKVLGIRHTANTLGPEPAASHRIQSLRRGAES